MKTVVLINATNKNTEADKNCLIPNQYLPLYNSTVLREIVLRFKNNSKVDNILCVINKEDYELYKESIEDVGLLNPIIGDCDSFSSIVRGFRALEEFDVENVIVHSALRVFSGDEVITGIIERLEFCDAVVSAVQEKVNLKRSESGYIVEDSINSEYLWQVQTPQGYKFKVIMDLIKRYGEEDDFQDIVSLCEHASVPVNIIPGVKSNVKILTQDDYKLAFSLFGMNARPLSCGIVKIGSGIEIYNFDKNDKNDCISLFGLQMLSDLQVKKKNSNIIKKDLGFCAVVSAVFGALGETVLGCTELADKKSDLVKNIPLLCFRHVVHFLYKKRGQIGNLDINIICNGLNIIEYRETIKKEIALILNVSVDKISLKIENNSKCCDDLIVQVACCINLPK